MRKSLWSQLIKIYPQELARRLDWLQFFEVLVWLLLVMTPGIAVFYFSIPSSWYMLILGISLKCTTFVSAVMLILVLNEMRKKYLLTRPRHHRLRKSH
jgi:hypothetical protein